MTQEEKELLLKDLCARLPYEVKIVSIEKPYIKGTLISIGKNFFGYCCYIESGDIYSVNVNAMQPYLRPMSSMTEKEKEEFENLLEGIVDGIERWDKPDLCEEYDWLNAHHFDYRGLIPMGLALEAPDGMYKLKEK